MSRVHKVQTTKVRQLGPADKLRKPGKPFNGPNTVAQRESSSKKNARKAASGRRKTA